MIILSDSQMATLLAETKAELIQRLLMERRDDLDLLTPAQCCGIFDVNQKTLDKLPGFPKRVTLIVGSLIRYRARDVAEYIRSRMDP